MIGNFFTYGNAGDAELAAASVVALHQHAYGVATVFGINHAGRSADAAFEFVADHAGAAAHVSFFDRAAVRGVECMEGVFRLDVETVHVV